VPVFHPGDVAPQEPRAFFDLALRESFNLPQGSETFSDNHSGYNSSIIASTVSRGKMALNIGELRTYGVPI
jgi:hypothetical protein